MTEKQLLAVGGFAAFVFALFWIAPIRKQAMNENHCIRHETERLMENKEPTKAARDQARARAYIRCNR